MGIIVTLLFWVLMLLLLTAALTLVAVLFALPGQKEGRSRRLLRAFIGTPVAVLSFCIPLFFLNLCLTTLTKTDCGLGDYFHVPLENGYRLCFIDTVGTGGYIERDEDPQDRFVDDIQLDGDVVYFRKGADSFALDTQTHQLSETPAPAGVELLPAGEFYFLRYREVNRVGWIVIVLICLALSASLTRLVCGLIRKLH